MADKGRNALYEEKLQKEQILKKLRENGYRITKQRQALLDIILENECSSCKEIYYKAAEKDHGIGTATVYRMVNLLEEIGAINRRNMYRVADSEQDDGTRGYIVVLNDHTTRYLPEKKMKQVLQAGLKTYGYLDDQDVSCITMKPQRRGKKDMY